MKYGKGFDVGTHMFVAAADNESGGIDFIEQIDAFFTNHVAVLTQTITQVFAQAWRELQVGQ